MTKTEVKVLTIDDVKKYLERSLRHHFSKEDLGGKVSEIFDSFAEYFGVTRVKFRDEDEPINYGIYPTHFRGVSANNISEHTHLFVPFEAYPGDTIHKNIDLIAVSDYVIGRDFEELEVLRRISQLIGSGGFEDPCDTTHPEQRYRIERRFKVHQIFEPPLQDETKYDYEKAFRVLTKVDHAFAEYVDYQMERDVNIRRIATEIMGKVDEKSK